MLKTKLIAITLPAIAFSAALPVLADTVTRYEVVNSSTTSGVTTPSVVEYRKYTSSTAPNYVTTRTIVNPVITPAPVVVPTAGTVKLVETSTPVIERRVLVNTNTEPMFVEKRVISQPVLIQRAPQPVVMETYNPPVVLEKRYVKHHRIHNDRVIELGTPVIQLRSY